MQRSRRWLVVWFGGGNICHNVYTHVCAIWASMGTHCVSDAGRVRGSVSAESSSHEIARHVFAPLCATHAIPFPMLWYNWNIQIHCGVLKYPFFLCSSSVPCVFCFSLSFFLFSCTLCMCVSSATIMCMQMHFNHFLLLLLRASSRVCSFGGW